MKIMTTITYPAFALFAFACCALAPKARATCQEGCLTSNNTVLGEDAFVNNFNGHDNTALGFNALYNNFGGFANTATGESALYSNAIGWYNTAIGNSAMYYTYNGAGNTACGFETLYTNTAGNQNTAIGQHSLYSNTRGHDNTAVGQDALFNNTYGSKNIALGANAGYNLTTGSHNIDIGNPGVADEAKTIRIGNQGTQTTTFIAGVSGAIVPTGVAVLVDSSGHLGTSTSSARFKETIKPMDEASEGLMALKPVTFRYKKQIDPAGTMQFGLVAEEVEKVNPDLVARDSEGKPYSVRYEAVNAMLLNEFLKEHKAFVEQHRKVQEQEATIAELKSAAAKQEANAAHQQKQIEALTAGLQKVSAQLAVRKSAPQTVGNNQ